MTITSPVRSLVRAIFFATAQDVMLALYLDDRHRLIGTAILAVG